MFIRYIGQPTNKTKILNGKSEHIAILSSRAENEIAKWTDVNKKCINGKQHAYFNLYHFYIACHFLFLSATNAHI